MEYLQYLTYLQYLHPHRPPNCQAEDRPFANETGELSPEGEEDIAVNNFLEYKCPGAY